jgi:hypothetical protein
MKIPIETKLRAVGEVLAENGSITAISTKYKLSASYLSHLTSKVRKVILATSNINIDFEEFDQRNSRKKESTDNIIMNLSEIKDKIAIIENIITT